MSHELVALTSARISTAIHDSLSPTTTLPPLAAPSLKRRASPSFECPDQSSRKRMKEERGDNDIVHLAEISNAESTSNFADDLAQELQCGCCAELVYRPVLVIPCQHFFCGSCCVLWIRNGGTNCPACRGVASVAMPFRALQPLIDSLIRNSPSKARTEREREQADEVYKSGQTIRIPPPREASPPPDVNRNTEYYHPCPHCLPNNPYDWRCPQPVADPSTDIDHAWHLDDGPPPGHAECRNCENLLALRAPTTTKCDLCFSMFCGIAVQDRCIALPLLSQHPHNMSSHADMIQSSEVYACFDGNTIEVEIMLEYLETQGLSPRHIYREIVQHIQKQPRGFEPLIEDEVFGEPLPMVPGSDPNVNTPRNRACRLCAQSVLIWGLKDWWVRERQKGFLEPSVMNRKDCPEGVACTRYKDDFAHAREFNHIFPTPSDDPASIPIPDSPITPMNAPQMLPEVSPSPTMRFFQDPPPISTGVSSSNSLSFLLNPDQDTIIAPPPEFHSHTPDVRDAINA